MPSKKSKKTVEDKNVETWEMPTGLMGLIKSTFGKLPAAVWGETPSGELQRFMNDLDGCKLAKKDGDSDD